MSAFPEGGLAVVIGAGGGVGGALLAALRGDARFAEVIGYARDRLDLADEASIAAAAREVAARGLEVRLVILATGVLHGPGFSPEKSWRELDAGAMAQVFAANAIGPALVMKHFLPLLPRAGKSVFAALSARVGSIGDNRLGGWYSYRASKAALNQMVRTAAVELGRGRREAVCVALHPGTVATKLSAPFGKGGLEVQEAAVSAGRLLSVIDGLGAGESGGFFDHMGKAIAW